MPYPESCPECTSTFRNTGTHFTARRNEVGRHVLLELGCQTTNRRFWWNFTTGQLASDEPRLVAAAAVGASTQNGNGTSSGHVALKTVQKAAVAEAEPPAASGDERTRPSAGVTEHSASRPTTGLNGGS